MVIAREGERGNEIYFITGGTLEITSADGANTHGTLEIGDYFGHLSLLLGERRTGAVRARTFCDLFVLNRDDFNKIKKEYPELRDVLKKVSSEKSEKMSALVMEGIVL